MVALDWKGGRVGGNCQSVELFRGDENVLRLTVPASGCTYL